MDASDLSPEAIEFRRLKREALIERADEIRRKAVDLLYDTPQEEWDHIRLLKTVVWNTGDFEWKSK
jgi:hypothetical protein